MHDVVHHKTIKHNNMDFTLEKILVEFWYNFIFLIFLIIIYQHFLRHHKNKI
jgi:hypothetical protein